MCRAHRTLPQINARILRSRINLRRNNNAIASNILNVPALFYGLLNYGTKRAAFQRLFRLLNTQKKLPPHQPACETRSSPHCCVVKQNMKQSRAFALMRATGRVRGQPVERPFNDLAPID
jgi:hypothetical protein